MTDKAVCVMLVAAEASGDTLGAGLARVLRARLGEGVRFVGVGGAKMAEQGVVSPFDIAELSILGLFEGVKAYRRVLRRVDETAALAAHEKPDIAVLIDSWGFTLRVAARLRKQTPDMPLIKYVGPQVWASRPGRAKTLAARVDHLLTIHAFDAALPLSAIRLWRPGLTTPVQSVCVPILAQALAIRSCSSCPAVAQLRLNKCFRSLSKPCVKSKV
jgi:lipid A disaccharide synthetase